MERTAAGQVPCSGSRAYARARSTSDCGSEAMRRAYSPIAGCSSICGEKGKTVASSNTTRAPMVVVSKPLASPELMTDPELTPT